jgi:hypothetical protein
MIICVSPPALPDLRPARRLANPAQPVSGIQGARAARPAARGCRAPPHPPPATPGPSRPRGPLRTDPPPAPKPADTPADHPRDSAALAPLPGHPEAGLPSPDRPPASEPGDHRADRAPRPRESRPGIPADPGRAAQARLPRERPAIRRVLRALKIPPASARQTDRTWRQFLHAQAATIFGERRLRAILAEYEAHYNGRRSHRSCHLHPPRPDHPTADLPRNGSSTRPSSAVSSVNTNEPSKSPAQRR